MNQPIFYCYYDKEPIVSPIKPKNFDQQEHTKKQPAPNIIIARQLYETDLKIKEWRK